ncbi:Exoenzymes regulatory protein AepA precursor [Alloactinosynnema sp. L-07]|uniref:amidohydrolase n=1 Tax=Alloactinosynnema sp. L-07 TaxID=1653480 RepID=UPI00065EFA6A|nr:amidohydrolase [Alloactinosynnema sp. L-07]CRK57361.1 Exoenzymes regulatory protein AepA precursor [Alloactinosynnema sp. L-07]
MTAADLVLRDATVHTMDPARPVAGAVAVRAGRIIAVGDNVDEHIGGRTEVVDGTGLTVTPGLVDSHQHPLMGIATRRGGSALGLGTLDELLDLVRRTAATTPDDGWVIIDGVEYDAIVTLPDTPRALIDRAGGGRPAFLMLADCHNALMSTEALRQAGITGPIGFGDRSEIVVDEHGDPTGLLHEMSAVLLGNAAVPPQTLAETARGAADLFAAQAACGITGIHVPDLWPGTEAVLDELDQSGQLPLRVLLAPWALPDDVDGTIETVRALRRRPRGWTVGAVKFFLDGTIDGGSAWLHHPDCAGESIRPFWTDVDRFERAARAVVDLGLPCFTHAIGDRAVSHVLDVYQRVGGGRHRVEHAEVLADADVGRFHALDVVASMQPTHLDWILPDHSDTWSARVGPDRRAQALRCADIVAAGGRVALGSDWPIADYDPRVVMAGARLRRPAGARDRAPVGPEQALSPRQALAGYTTWAAYGAGEELIAGRIKEGARADLTVFGGDPLTLAADELVDLPVAMTIVGGRIAHRAEA